MVAASNYDDLDDLENLLPGCGSPNLAKAAQDCWGYIVALSTGERFFCRSIESCGDFIRLNDAYPLFAVDADEFYFGDRPIDVRLSAVVWVADSDS